jgi:hypothetical protein
MTTNLQQIIQIYPNNEPSEVESSSLFLPSSVPSPPPTPESWPGAGNIKGSFELGSAPEGTPVIFMP